jgi:hypothetical protein
MEQEGTLYTVTITGYQGNPLFMHADDIAWADQMDTWRRDPPNKTETKPGDDRSPAWRWLGSVYHDDTQLVLPTANLQKCLMEGGAQVLVPNGRGKTYKALTQSGCQFMDLSWPLLVQGAPIPWAPLEALMEEPDFAMHTKMAREHGFTLDVRRVLVQGQRHIRVRPCFKDWSASGRLWVSDERLSPAILARLWDVAGDTKGVGDWRPSSKTPGPHGRFWVQIAPAADAARRRNGRGGA